MRTHHDVMMRSDFESSPGRISSSPSPSAASASEVATAFRKRVANGLEGVYFHLTGKWFLIGLLISLLGFALLAWRARFAVEPQAWFLGVWRG